MTTAIVIAATACAAGYLLGRIRPWRRLGDWAEDQICFARRQHGGRTPHIGVALFCLLTRPRAGRRIVHDGPPTPVLAPAFDPDWAAKRTALAESPSGPEKPSAEQQPGSTG